MNNNVNKTMNHKENVNAALWRDLLSECVTKIDEALQMARWYAGTSRMKETEALNIVLYEDGEVDILCSKNSENREYIEIDGEYFKNHRAFIAISRITKYSPYDNWMIGNYGEIREVIYKAIENEHLWNVVCETIGNKNELDKLTDEQLVDTIKSNKKISDIVCDYLAKELEYLDLDYLSTDYSDLFLELSAIGDDVFACSNHYKMYDGISNKIFCDYNNFRLICQK